MSYSSLFQSNAFEYSDYFFVITGIMLLSVFQLYFQMSSVQYASTFLFLCQKKKNAIFLSLPASLVHINNKYNMKRQTLVLLEGMIVSVRSTNVTAERTGVFTSFCAGVMKNVSAVEEVYILKKHLQVFPLHWLQGLLRRSLLFGCLMR